MTKKEATAWLIVSELVDMSNIDIVRYLHFNDKHVHGIWIKYIGRFCRRYSRARDLIDKKSRFNRTSKYTLRTALNSSERNEQID